MSDPNVSCACWTPDHQLRGLCRERQYIIWGNLIDNPKAHLFLVGYATRQRVKLWGRAEMVENHNLTASLMPEGYRAGPEQALFFHLDDWEVDYSEHIPPCIDTKQTDRLLAANDADIAALEVALAKQR